MILQIVLLVLLFLMTPLQSNEHVIVIGSGLAGLTTTLSLAAEGIHVKLLDKNNQFGGNSAKASSGMNSLSHHQVEQGIIDTKEAFIDDTLKSGKISKPELVDVLTSESGRALEWIEATADLNLSIITKCGGHSNPRTHRTPGAVGWNIVSSLFKKLPQDVEVVFGARATKLIVQAGRVCGVLYEKDGKQETFSGIVVLATGGYSHDWTETSLLNHAYGSSLAKISKRPIPTTNGEFATGDGIKLGMEIGAAVVDLEHVQLHPTGFVNPAQPDENVKILAPEALRAYGGVLVNEKGARFVNELETRDKVSDAILNQERAWLIMDIEIESKIDLSFYKKKGLVRGALSKEEICDELHFELSVFADSLKQFSSHSYLFAEITPVVHYSMGGLVINSNAQVLDENGKVIQGLYAAGETTGGVHGKNRLAGNSLLECVVFGRRAAKSVKQYFK